MLEIKGIQKSFGSLHIRADRSIVPSFNTFYEYMRDDYRKELSEIGRAHV